MKLDRYKRYRFWAVSGLVTTVWHSIYVGLHDPDVGWWAAIPATVFGISLIGVVLDALMDKLEQVGGHGG